MTDKTPLTAAAQWTGERFMLDEVPHWLMLALGAGNIGFSEHELLVTTDSGQVTGNPTDWLILSADTGLGVATDADFNANYEITG